VRTHEGIPGWQIQSTSQKVTIDYHYGNRPAETIESKDYTRTALQNLRIQLTQREDDEEWIFKLWENGANTVMISGKELYQITSLVENPTLNAELTK
jgi:hypothetical protein